MLEPVRVQAGKAIVHRMATLRCCGQMVAGNEAVSSPWRQLK